RRYARDDAVRVHAPENHRSPVAGGVSLHHGGLERGRASAGRFTQGHPELHGLSLGGRERDDGTVAFYVSVFGRNYQMDGIMQRVEELLAAFDATWELARVDRRRRRRVRWRDRRSRGTSSNDYATTIEAAPG